MFKKFLSVLIISFVLVGCGDKTLDASSPESLKKSSAEVIQSLSETDQAKFKQALISLSFISMKEANFDDDKTLNIIREKVNGKTAKEIIKEYGDN